MEKTYPLRFQFRIDQGYFHENNLKNENVGENEVVCYADKILIMDRKSEGENKFWDMALYAPADSKLTSQDFFECLLFLAVKVHHDLDPKKNAKWKNLIADFLKGYEKIVGKDCGFGLASNPTKPVLEIVKNEG